MRVLLWNCNNGMAKPEHISYFKSFRPDIAIIPELKMSNLDALDVSDAVWVTNNHSNPKPKGLGVVCFNEYSMVELDRDEDMEIFIPLKVSKGHFSFNLLAVWNFYYASKQGRFAGVKGENCLEWSAMRHYCPSMADPSLIIGDWNFGPKCFPESFSKLCGMAENYCLKSLYHSFHSLDEADSNHVTFKTTRGNFHQIDHFFGSETFQKTIRSYEIDEFKNVVLSDHAPTIVEFEV